MAPGRTRSLALRAAEHGPAMRVHPRHSVEDWAVRIVRAASGFIGSRIAAVRRAEQLLDELHPTIVGQRVMSITRRVCGVRCFRGAQPVGVGAGRRAVRRRRTTGALRDQRAPRRSARGPGAGLSLNDIFRPSAGRPPRYRGDQRRVGGAGRLHRRHGRPRRHTLTDDLIFRLIRTEDDGDSYAQSLPGGAD
jgi:hypothetical protein